MPDNLTAITVGSAIGDDVGGRKPQLAGRVRLTPDKSTYTQVTLRMAAPARVVAGYGDRFETIDREQRIQLLRYLGREALQIALPVIFDGFADRASIEDDYRPLQALHRPAGDAHPPLVTAAGAMPHTAGRKWVVRKLDEDEPMFLPTGDRCRQAVTVTLVEWIAVDVGDNQTAAQLNQSRAGTIASTTYTTVAGDTLEKVALRAYRDKRRWRDLRRANRGVLHAETRNSGLPVGLNLTIPPLA